MINKVLFKKEWKNNYKLLLIFLAIVTLYGSVIVFMFDPELGKSLEMMAQSMPELFSAFGMNNTDTTLTSFVANYLYGFIMIVVPVICILTLTHRLVIKYIEQGSMAYLLATPHSRKNIVTTQMVTQCSMLITIVLYTLIIIVTLGSLLFPGHIDILACIRLNIGLLGLLLFLSSLNFFFACICKDTRMATLLSAGTSLLFILLQMLSQVSDSISILKYLTPLTLFQSENLVQGDNMALGYALLLYLGALVFYSLARYFFNKRDLTI